MNIIFFEKLESTHTYAKQNICLLEDKTIISTDNQTSGYGRFKRSWVNLGKENIYMTFVLKPSDKLSNIYANLTQYLSVCICKQLEETGLYPQIKWPNDVLLNNKKVSGILAEAIIKNNKLQGIVLSIGVNLNVSEKDLNKINQPVTGVNIELGRFVNKQEFTLKLIENFFKNYDEFLEKGFGLIKDDYEKRALLKIGTGNEERGAENIKILAFNLIKEGTFKGFDDNGNLILLTANGETEIIRMGEIT